MPPRPARTTLQPMTSRRPTPARLAWILSASLLLAGPAAALAHDMWLQPSSFSPQGGELVKLAVRLGIPGPAAEAVPRSSVRWTRFEDKARTDLSSPILGEDGVDPAGLLRPRAPGLHVLLLESGWAVSELDAARFEDYLREEGLESVLAARRSAGDQDLPGREVYSRHLKALLLVGPPSAEQDRPLGLKLELVCETPFAALAAGKPLVVRLLFHDQPFAGALLEARRLDGSGPVVRGRSDLLGRWVVEAPTSGGWLLTTTVMQAAPPASGAQWESFWASLTLAVPPP